MITGSGSSLQKAIAAEADTGTKMNVTAETEQKGNFELCFAGGLDFSDAGLAASTAGVSHAAMLLKRKEVEAVERLNQKEEDDSLDAALLLRRDLSTRAAAAANNGPGKGFLRAAPPAPVSSNPQDQSCFDLFHTNINGSNLVNSLVVEMHGMEQTNEPRHKVTRKSIPNQKPTSTSHTKSMRANPKSTSTHKQKTPSKGKGQQVAKKSTRHKY